MNTPEPTSPPDSRGLGEGEALEDGTSGEHDAKAACTAPSPAAVLQARQGGIDPRAVQRQAEQAARVERLRDERQALIDAILTRQTYAPYRLTLGSIVRRHHLRPGEPARTRSERYMDRRGPSDAMHLQSAAERGPYRTPIYPSRIAKADAAKRAEPRKCEWCEFAFEGRKDAQFCSDACRKAAKRAAMRDAGSTDTA